MWSEVTGPANPGACGVDPLFLKWYKEVLYLLAIRHNDTVF